MYKESKRASKASSAISHARYTDQQVSEYISRIVETETYQRDLASDKGFFNDIPTIYCPHAPKQLNGHDCGIFTYMFLESFCSKFPTSLPADLDNSFHDWIQQSTMFSQEDVPKERRLYVSSLKEAKRLENMRTKGASGVVSSCFAAINTPTRHQIVLEGCFLIGRLHAFVDATIHNWKDEYFSCNAGTVLTFGNKDPVLLIMFAASFSASSSSSSSSSIDNLQVILRNSQLYQQPYDICCNYY